MVYRFSLYFREYYWGWGGGGGTLESTIGGGVGGGRVGSGTVLRIPCANLGQFSL